MNANAVMNTRSRRGGEFLLIDAATAHTLLDVAESTHDVVIARRDIRLASETLDTMNRYLETLSLEPALRIVIERSRDRLQMRLAAMERRFAAA